MVQNSASYPSLLILLLRLFTSSASAAETESDSIRELQLVHDRTQRLDGGKHVHFHVPNKVCPSQTALKIVLESIDGDADLYISSFADEPKPTYLSYGLKATSYGVDVVDVPATMARPLAIGVYAHPFHESSVFRMRIYIDPYNSIDEFSRILQDSCRNEKSYEELASGGTVYDKYRQSGTLEREIEGDRGAQTPPKSESNIGGGGKKSTHRIEDKSSWITTLLLHILEFMVEVFL